MPAKQCERAAIHNTHHAYLLDDYLATQHFNPTLKECGLPGLSEHIIAGAEQTIKTYKPKLILVDSPGCKWLSLIKEWVPDYKVYYSECGRDSYGVFFLSNS